MTGIHSNQAPCVVVSDAGPLMALAKVSALNLLNQLYGQVLTTPAVHTEAVTAGLAHGAPDAKILAAAFSEGRLQVRIPTLGTLPVPTLLHRGEKESLCLAIELPAVWFLVDDLAARQAAEANFTAAHVSTGVKGTLGVIVSAYQRRCIGRETAIDLINTLKMHPDVWLSTNLCDHVIMTLRTR